jgi:hypothetical protein
MRKTLTACLTLAGIALAAWTAACPAATPPSAVAADKAQAMIAHSVYFSLKDNAEPAKKKLVAACKKYLAGHPGTVFFAAGTLTSELDRPVNDRDFDVALHVVFKTKAAHDDYQKAERHLKFIAENQDNWKKVRVFDSTVEN